ncbi:NUDIX domain-containing protein [Hoyosella sp. G463]|uniref:NUDIX domain-containing protein n=1 Tax=Lolliginicoccus lacisalsi TaxID=2742202 RepID=A0A927JB45_9ACTN|nr:NUDIX domain-containing protein [Lolliginicoccus lacisalsi]
MAIPEFILQLRQHVGTSLLWLTGVSAVVRNEHGEILLARRADSGEWAVISGILEPGEEAGPAMAREVAEEAGIEVVLERITSVTTSPVITYPNGDQAQYVDICFIARHAAGTPRPADGENTDIGWFPPDRLPPDLAATSRERIRLALSTGPETWFQEPR